MTDTTEREAFDKLHIQMAGSPSFRTWSKWNSCEERAAWEAWQARAALASTSTQATDAELKKWQIRHLNFVLDLQRVLGWEKPLNGFAEIEALEALLASHSSKPAPATYTEAEKTWRRHLGEANREGWPCVSFCPKHMNKIVGELDRLRAAAPPPVAGDVCKSLNAMAADLLRPYLKPGQKVIWREAFRWHDDNGVLPNHQDGKEVHHLCDEFGYTVDWEFNMRHACIITPSKQEGV